MGYYGYMGYGMHFSANQLGGPKKIWGIREYGLSELWVMRELTVLTTGLGLHIKVGVFLQCVIYSNLLIFYKTRYQACKKCK